MEKISNKLKELIDKDTKLKTGLFEDKNKLELKQIISFLDELSLFIKSTFRTNEYATALTLFDKWNINLLAFYDYNEYDDNVYRSPSDFSDDVLYPYFDKTLNPEEKKSLDKYKHNVNKKLPSDNIMAYETYKEGLNDYDISKNEIERFRKAMGG